MCLLLDLQGYISFAILCIDTNGQNYSNWLSNFEQIFEEKKNRYSLVHNSYRRPKLANTFKISIGTTIFHWFEESWAALQLESTVIILHILSFPFFAKTLN